MIATRADALGAIDNAWPLLCEECLSVLGSELHYQAMIYHALRTAGGVPVDQLGMNVKQWIPDVHTDLFKRLDQRKHKDYRGGFEPTPDAVIFSREIHGDWRRRNREQTVKSMLAVVEIKASERAGKRLSPKEVFHDIEKLAAHKEETSILGCDFAPVMLVIDSARHATERMTRASIGEARALASSLAVEWRYVSPEGCIVDRPS